MEIIFRNNSTEDDVVSIINLLKLGNEHQRVKKYICEFFSLPEGILIEKNNQILEESIKKVVINEKLKSKVLIEKKIKQSFILWNENKKNINEILSNIFQCKQDDEIINALLSINCVCPYDFEKRIIYINYRKSVEEIHHRPEEGDHHARYAEGHPARTRRA